MNSRGNDGQPSPGNATEAQWEVLQLDVVPGGGGETALPEEAAKSMGEEGK